MPMGLADGQHWLVIAHESIPAVRPLSGGPCGSSGLSSRLPLSLPRAVAQQVTEVVNWHRSGLWAEFCSGLSQ